MKIRHCGYDESKASARTRAVRWSAPETRDWLTTTQVWKWRGGDAIVVVTNDVYRRPTAHVVVRVGEKVSVIEGSVTSALEALGFTKIAVAAPKKGRL